MSPAPVCPPVLQGQLVAVVSPASWPDADDDVRDLRALLESWGLRVRVGAHALDRHGYLAGRDDDRLADLNAAIADPEVRAIVTTRGGCGSLRLVRAVDTEALRRDPKPLVGYSDITALHLVWHEAGVPSLHGAAVGGFADDVRRLLTTPGDSVVEADPDALTAPLTTSGTAAGPLVGGSLEMLARSVGVVRLDLTGRVLLLEANRAAGLGMVDRALSQLVLSGSLEGVVGVAVGTMAGFAGYEDRGWTVIDVLQQHLEPLGVPVLGGLPIGHGDDNRTVPLGVTCTLDADRGRLTSGRGSGPPAASR